MTGLGQRLLQRRGTRLALAVLLLLVLGAAGAGLLSPHAPAEQFRDALLHAPDGPGGPFPLGTDGLGRDLFARLLHGARLTLGLALAAVLAAMLPGITLGLLAAQAPRGVGELVLRISDVLLALPGVLLAIAVVAVLGPGLLNTVLAVALSSLPGYVRLARATALGELARPYAMAARAVGAGPARLMARHVLPNCLGPLIVNATLDFSGALLTVTGLGFLGLGAQPPAPEWGTMLADARDVIGRADWVIAWPGLAILVTVLCVNVVGDALADTLDPRRSERG